MSHYPTRRVFGLIWPKPATTTERARAAHLCGDEQLSGRLLEGLRIQVVQQLLRVLRPGEGAALPEERCAVAIMAKASVAGTVKTRAMRARLKLREELA